MPNYNYDEKTYRIADIYRSVEQEAFSILGMPIVLVRFVFPNFVPIHLLPERDVPHKELTAQQIIDEIERLGNGPVHFIEDDPVLCGVDAIIEKLDPQVHPMYLNTCGYFDTTAGDKLEGLFIQTKPSLAPNPTYLAMAKEIRAYWKPGDEEYTAHVMEMDSRYGDQYRDKMYLNPYNVDEKTVQETLTKALELGWRFGLRLSSVAPNSDKHLQNVPEAEEVYHERYKKDLGMQSSDVKVSVPVPPLRRVRNWTEEEKALFNTAGLTSHDEV